VSDPTENDFLEAEVESTVAPLRAMGLSEEAVAEVADALRIALTAHPGGRYLMRRARPRAQKESGSSPIEEMKEIAAEARDVPAKAGSSR
jgi:hypothetical protein